MVVSALQSSNRLGKDYMTDNNQSFDIHAFQQQVIKEFRENNGKLGGMFEGWKLILLTTTGAKTGLRRTSLLGPVKIGGKTLVIASAMGAPTHPAWYHNIRKDPMVTVETGTETYDAIAAIPPGDERDELFGKVVAEQSGFADYQAKTTRVIPVVVLHRITPDPGAERVKGLGDWLVEVHSWLREELITLRRQADEGVPLRLGKHLREHCLSFCEALTKHHTGEDMGAFPMLARQFPALAPALRELGEEHAVVAELQTQIRALVTTETDPTRLRTELNRLATRLESHFDHEERTVVQALNALAAAPM
jgi:deazaflavin-dependent oxidoreductase (nitroreductase family)